jgi:hypothetical protein
MQQYMVEHGSQSVLGIVVLGCDLNRFRDRNAQAAVAIGRGRENAASHVGFH